MEHFYYINKINQFSDFTDYLHVYQPPNVTRPYWPELVITVYLVHGTYM